MIGFSCVVVYQQARVTVQLWLGEYAHQINLLLYLLGFDSVCWSAVVYISQRLHDVCH